MAPGHLVPAQTCGVITLIAAVILGGFLSEDGATITAATFAMSSLLDFRLAFLSAIAGLWVGDLGVYFVARGVGSGLERTGWLSRWFTGKQLSSNRTLEQNTPWKLAVSRFLPGTRLPAYISAGLGRMPLCLFATITAISATAWTILVFATIHAAPSRSASAKEHLATLSVAGLSLFVALTALRIWGQGIHARIRIALRRLVRWEFWPAWLFYSPVALFCAWLGIRYRGFSLPTIANLNQKNGGIVGESKVEILREFMNVSPDVTAEAYLIEPGPAAARAEKIAAICRLREIPLPFVLKPDIGQRGAGFRKVASFEEASRYVAQVSAPLLLQRYVPGPREAGIFYYRFPHETRGHIFGITRKRFPFVVGDGEHTLKELIERNPRARLIARAYFTRFGNAVAQIPALGEQVRLVEAGNHCQGCVFEDGSDLNSDRLLQAIDQISRKIPGFYVGRFDIRYETDEELRAGMNFKIIELNGAASEATNIYDERNSLWHAYVTLYRQWRLVYAIGAANRRLGASPVSAYTLWSDWKKFSRQACEYPVAD